MADLQKHVAMFSVAHFRLLCKMLNIETSFKEAIRMYIFRTWITTKDGKRIYARDYGLRAFRIWISPIKER